MENDFDDVRCVACGKELVDNPEVGTPDFDGYCSAECAAAQEGADEAVALVDSEIHKLMEANKQLMGYTVLANVIYWNAVFEKTVGHSPAMRAFVSQAIDALIRATKPTNSPFNGPAANKLPC